MPTPSEGGNRVASPRPRPCLRLREQINIEFGRDRRVVQILVDDNVGEFHRDTDSSTPERSSASSRASRRSAGESDEPETRGKRFKPP